MTSMPTPEWLPKVVREAPGAPVVVVDFSSLSRGRDAIDVIAEALPDECLLRFDAVDFLTGEANHVSLVELADRAAAGLARTGRTPRLIIGYCSGASLAMSIANHLQPGTPVRLALLGPGFPTWDHVADDLSELLETLGSTAGTGAGVPESGPACRDHVDAAIDDALRNAAEVMGMTPDEAEVLTIELGARYKAWLRYLILTVEAEVPVVAGDMTVLEMTEPWAAPPLGWPTHATRVPCEQQRDGFLDAEGAADTVRVLVEAAR